MAERRIAIAMSGGVDSSVAALKLANAGEDVFGLMLRLWSSGPEQENRCCSPRDMANARRIADELNIPFYVLDAKERFKNDVVNRFLEGYTQGITPNPCVSCNRLIRWGFLYERAMAMGATHLATGHYARVEKHNGRFELHRAVDKSKDQSYVLHVLDQERLRRSVFPIGDLAKSEVRAYAREHDLQVADRKDSQDLCFLGEMDYRTFLEQREIPLLEPGPIIDLEGKVLGQHSGLAGYTIGQRKGIGIAAPEPYYVVDKDVTDNSLIIGMKRELGRDKFQVVEVNWISGEKPATEADLVVQIRYKASPVPADIHPTKDGKYEVRLSQPLVDVTPGQWAVFYSGDICLGGGRILR